MTKVNLQTVRDSLPQPLQQRFELGANAAVSIQICQKLSDWFAISGVPFFKNYTDHSSKHSMDVFQTSIELINQSAYDYITSNDICFLLMASFIHDAGMHITERQFTELVSKSNGLKVDGLDDQRWSSLWYDFLQEAKAL